MEMYDLSSGGGGGTAITYNPQVPEVPKPGSSTERDTGYEAQRSAFERKNNDAQQQEKPMQMSSMAFSTPISELDYDDNMNGPQGPGSADMHMIIPPQSSVAPHEMLMAQPQAQQAPQVQVAAAAPPSPVYEDKKYPLGLTKEQYEALIVAILVALVFYPDVQAKLAIYIPNFMSKDGSRSMAGLAASGLIVAVGFYLGRRYLVN